MPTDNLSSEMRSYVMSRIRSRGTRCERRLRAALVGNGVKGFKLQYEIVGRPDVAFPRQKVAVFCDSEFWHGRKGFPASNRKYWIKKLKGNRLRDVAVTSKLSSEGWNVIRLSEAEVLQSPSSCVKAILEMLHSTDTS